MPEASTCALCSQQASLLKSHIIPKFTINWLKKTSATGYLRQAIEPNIRQQDGPKKRLLCASCEDLFSKSEKLFAENVWVPYQEEHGESFEYGEWLRSFAISLAWRTLTVGIEEFRRSHPESEKLIQSANEALSWWRAYLLKESSNPGPCEHHMLFVNSIIVPEDERHLFPAKGLHYLRRGFDSTIVSNGVFIAAYTKLPGIVFFSTIRPIGTTKWKGTRISRQGVLRINQTVEDERFGDFIASRVKMITTIEAKLSQKQQDQINKSIMDDPERAANSESLNTYLLEKELRKR